MAALIGDLNEKHGTFRADQFGLVVISAYAGTKADSEKDRVLAEARPAEVRDYLVKPGGYERARRGAPGDGFPLTCERPAAYPESPVLLSEEPRIVTELFGRTYTDLREVRMPRINEPVRFSRSENGRHYENGCATLADKVVANYGEAGRRQTPPPVCR